jgi:hypothetical protein
LFDIAARVGRLLIVWLVVAQAIPEGFYTPAKLPGNFANAPGSEQEQDNQQNDNPFSATR